MVAIHLHFLPEIHAEERQKPSTKKTSGSFSNLQNPVTSERLLHMRHTHLNACAAKENIRDFARETFADDLRRMEYIPGNYYNFHPGSHVGQGAEVGIQKIAEILNDVFTEGQSTTVLLETMSGKGSEVGRNFEELREIIDLVHLNDKMGVCLDTCHVWDGGYDIVNDLDGVLMHLTILSVWII